MAGTAEHQQRSKAYRIMAMAFQQRAENTFMNSPCHSKKISKKTAQSGFSLVELLVVIAIISILTAMYAAVGVRAISKAKRVAVVEGMRQEHIGRLADNANMARSSPSNTPSTAEEIREQCRAAFRQKMDLGGRELIFTELLCVVKSEAEFRAYWYTLVNPDATGAVTLAGNRSIVVQDENGQSYTLEWRDRSSMKDREIYPVIWEFLSTDTKHMSAESLGITVMFSDGHVEYLPYPSRYPATRVVAELSQRFMDRQ